VLPGDSITSLIYVVILESILAILLFFAGFLIKK
jgi:hypothetical protein